MQLKLFMTALLESIDQINVQELLGIIFCSYLPYFTEVKLHNNWSQLNFQITTLIEHTLINFMQNTLIERSINLSVLLYVLSVKELSFNDFPSNVLNL